jgi:hypothetical protein
MENMNTNIDFSKYINVICDSKDALEWAYEHGLSKDAVIRTSSPALLLDNSLVTEYIEDRWRKKKEFIQFQSSIELFSQEIYSSVLSIPGLTHEEAVCVSHASTYLQHIIYKAACWNEQDANKEMLFLKVSNENSNGGNYMNAPWDILLNDYSKLSIYTFKLPTSAWKILSTSGVSTIYRAYLGGVHTLIYRFFTSLYQKLPKLNSSKVRVLVPNENELLIEIAANLMLKGVTVKEIQKNDNDQSNINISSIKEKISPIVQQRVLEWVAPILHDTCESIFFEMLNESLNSFYSSIDTWEKVLGKETCRKKVLLTGALGNINGFSIAYVSKKMGIPLVSVQHGVTVEINNTHGELMSELDVNVSDLAFCFNKSSASKNDASFFKRGNSVSVGLPKRYFRMNNLFGRILPSKSQPIVYVSTNLYRGNLGMFGGCLTDYERAKNEIDLINNVFNQLPHKVTYKPYIEERRRYPDIDPAIVTASMSDNIDVFEGKIDMRFLLKNYRILISSVATSTLSWLIMSNKPTIFINNINDGPLTPDALESFSKGIFVFNSNDDLHSKLKAFLSRPIGEIEAAWNNKKASRKKMINDYFSSSRGDAGYTAAKIISDKYF